MKSNEHRFFTTRKHFEFIEDFEDKWLQFASAEERMKAYFGNLSNAKKLFEKWEKGEDLFAKKRIKAFL